MTIHIINKGFGDQFYRLLDTTKREINIISPFIGSTTAESLALWLEETEDVKCNIITRFVREEFIQGASSVTGLKRLVDSGAKCYALRKLHTKLYLFDTHSLIMGSANFTFHGFYKNHEFGLYMENELAFSQECNHYFNIILNKVNKEWEITSDLLENEIKIVNKIRHDRLDKKNVNEFNTWEWGGEIDDLSKIPALTMNQKDIIEESINKVSFEKDTGIWLKFEGTSQSRIDSKEVYLNRKRRLYEILDRTHFPRNPTGIKNGDTIFLAVVSFNKEGKGVPLIIGYAKTTGFNYRNVIDVNDPKFKKWNGHFKYFIELTDGKFLNSNMENGISLKDLCYDLNHQLYPSTVGKVDTKVESILKRHYQKSHLQITPKAKDYLKNKLDQLFSIYGYEQL